MPESLQTGPSKATARRSLRSLDWINFCMADLQTGVGPFVAIYLTATRHWDPAQVGLVVATQNIAMVLAQGPAGALVDWSIQKKWIGAVAAVFVAVGAVGIVLAQTPSWEMLVQTLIGGAGTVFPPLIAAISLGIVGKAALAPRVGRNEAFNHAGNVGSAVLAGLAGAYFGPQWIFYLASLTGCITVVACLSIRNQDIDNRRARAAAEDSAGSNHPPKAIGALLADKRILIFAACVVIFHFSNAAMLPLVGEVLSKGKGNASSLFMSACITVAQVVMIPVALLTARFADRIGRKPIFLFGFAVLALRGVLFAAGHAPAYLIAVQSLDGVAAAIFGVLWTLIIADLAEGTGRFNLLQGGIIAASNLGAFLSNSIAGWVAKTAGHSVSFLGLSALAAVGFAVFAMFMPETKETSKSRPHEASLPVSPTA